MFRSVATFALYLGLAAQAAPVAGPKPPVAPTKPHVVASPFGDRADEYHWMRDDDPLRKRPEVLRHLQAENTYAGRMMAPLARMRAELVAEMKGHVPADDSVPPWFDNGHWYWERFAKGAEHPALMRRAGTPEGPNPKAREELVLDQARQARGQPFYSLGQAAVQPGWLLARLDRGHARANHAPPAHPRPEDRPDPARSDAGVLEPVVWSADNRSVFYLQQDPVTLQGSAVRRHVVGTPARRDTVVYEEADKTLTTALSASASRQYLLIQMEGYDTTELRAVPTDRPDSLPVTIHARRSGVLSWATTSAGAGSSEPTKTR